jgi:hypothetical protein
MDDGTAHASKRPELPTMMVTMISSVFSAFSGMLGHAAAWARESSAKRSEQ